MEEELLPPLEIHEGADERLTRVDVIGAVGQRLPNGVAYELVALCPDVEWLSDGEIRLVRGRRRVYRTPAVGGRGVVGYGEASIVQSHVPGPGEIRPRGQGGFQRSFELLGVVLPFREL